MDGWEYEKKCAEYLGTLGFSNIQVTAGSGDFGCDILAFNHEKKYGIQCKYFNEEKVGVKAIQEAVAGSIFYDCDIPMVITSSSFTDKAIEYAKKCNVELISELDAVKIVIALKGKKNQDSNITFSQNGQRRLLTDMLRRYLQGNIVDFINIIKGYRDKLVIREKESYVQQFQKEICQYLLNYQYQEACNLIEVERTKQDKKISNDELLELSKKTEKQWHVMNILTDYMDRWNVEKIKERFCANGFGYIGIWELESMVDEGVLECVNEQNDILFYIAGNREYQLENISSFEQEIEMFVRNTKQRMEREKEELTQKKNSDIEKNERNKTELMNQISNKQKEINDCFGLFWGKRKRLREELTVLQKELSDLPLSNEIEKMYNYNIIQLEKMNSDEMKEEEKKLIGKYGILEWYYDSHNHIV